MYQQVSRKIRGFTLIELMVTIVIVSILMAIAIPSYRSYVFRSYLSEAFEGLSTFQIRMEQSYLDNGNYGAGAACNVANPVATHFNFACVLTNAGQGFTLTATANNANSFTGYAYTINQASTRTTTVFPGAGGLPAACWLIHVGDC